MTKNKLVFLFLLFSATLLFGSGGKERKQLKIKSCVVTEIDWKLPVFENGSKYHFGSILADFGRLDIAWKIDSDRISSLIVRVAAGSAELSTVEKRIYPFVLSDGSSLLFMIIQPLLQEQKPAYLQLLARVSSASLFSVLPGEKIPQASTIENKPNPLTWSPVFHKGTRVFIEGKNKNNRGSVTIIWKKDGENLPSLIVLDSRGGGELPAVEIPLYAWEDSASGYTVLFMERFPQLNQGSCSYLWPLTTIKTKDFLSGYNVIADY